MHGTKLCRRARGKTGNHQSHELRGVFVAGSISDTDSCFGDRYLSEESPSDDPFAFEQAIAQSVPYWRRHSAAGGDAKPRRVLIDLMVDHPVYYLGNLILGKYLELTQGLKPWGLVGSAADQKIILLARSFGVEQFTFVRDEVAKEVRPETAQILRQLEGASEEELRRRVLGLNLNEIPVGDILYDTYLREARHVTMREVDDDLRAYSALMLNYYAIYDQLLTAADVGAAVMGHLYYLRFGMLSRLCAAHGVDVFARDAGKGLRVQRRRGMKEVSDVMLRISPEMISEAKALGGASAVSIGEDTLARRMSGTSNEYEYLNEEGYSPDRARVTEDSLSKSLGLSPDRPKGLLVVHAFPDASHCPPNLLFDDFYDWYAKTLEKVREFPDVDWLIKPHPHLGYYTDDVEPQRRAEAAAAECAHIHLISEDVNTAGLSAVTDFTLSINGKVGLEFAGHNVPAILAGGAFYAGLGFTEEPKTAEDYYACLARGPVPSLSEGQRETALIASDIYYRQTIVDCQLMPDSAYNFWKPYDEGEFWRSFAAGLEQRDVQDDILFRSFSHMLASDSDTLFRPDRYDE